MDGYSGKARPKMQTVAQVRALRHSVTASPIRSAKRGHSNSSSQSSRRENALGFRRVPRGRCGHRG